MKYKKGDRVITPEGAGVVDSIESYRKFDRVLVKHDVQHFPWPLAAYFNDEIQLETKQEPVAYGTNSL